MFSFQFYDPGQNPKTMTSQKIVIIEKNPKLNAAIAENPSAK